VLVLSSALFAADVRRLALFADAQTAFDRVDRTVSPQLADASACVQAQAATLAVALPAEQPELHFRKGYCELAVAAVTRAAFRFSDAASDLDLAGANMMAWIARQAGQAGGQPTWTTPDACPSSCRPFLPTASLWLGWLDLRRGDLEGAAQHFSALPESGWPALAAGRKAFQAGLYAEAAARYGQVLDLWTRDQRLSDPPLALRLAPPADVAQLLADLGGAQLLSGDPRTAVATLDRAVQTASSLAPSAAPYLPSSAAPAPSPASSPARTFFLRARAKELAGQAEPALADYNLASRAAFANAADLASGEAHLYRGILYYRRRDYARAEEEFASALNFEIAPALRPDASAWRHLSAVAQGFCGASREFLERSLPAVSPYFPKDEAREVAARCTAAVSPAAAGGV
jgi:tetratricopeptide (TPR) repeat protein